MGADGNLFTADGKTLVRYPSGGTARSYTVPSGVETVGNFSFCGSPLLSVTLSEGVKNLNYAAFLYCWSLEKVSLPASVTHIGGSAFGMCVALRRIDVAADSTTFYSDADGVLFSKDQTALLKYPLGRQAASYTVPDSVTQIDQVAFCQCRALEEIIIPAGVTEIGEQAFSICAKLKKAVIYAPYVQLAENVFSGSAAGFTVHGFENSTAKRYAAQNGYRFTEITDTP